MKPAIRKGLSLIEVVFVIMILGVSIPVLLRVWADLGWRSSRSEVISDATFYAQQLLEEIKSKRYDENDDTPWTSSANFGPDTGESSNNADTFDDVDDFVGCTDPRVTIPATNYTRSVNVEYYRLNGSTWEACGQAVTCVNPLNCANCNDCCYKRIVVTVSRSDNLVKDVKLATMVSGY